MSDKQPKRKNALGKGLGALLGDSEPTDDKKQQGSDPSGGDLSEIAISSIEVNPYQPRTDFDEEALQELADSISEHGIIQPITVRRLDDNHYQLISGERRLQASKKAGLNKIPAYVRSADNQQMLEMALIENIQREDLNAIEVALSYQRLISDIGLKQEELGKRVSKNRTTVNNYLRLLKLPPDIQAGLRDRKISMGHARALINVDNVDLQLDLFRQIIASDLSVRKVEALVRAGQKLKKAVAGAKSKGKTTQDPEIRELQSKLASHFGTKVEINSENNKGEIKIPFVSIDDLNRILEILEV